MFSRSGNPLRESRAWLLARQLRRNVTERTQRRRLKRIHELFLKNYEPRVLQGPFTGMSYPVVSHNSEYLPKLIGSYESELTGVIEEVIRRRYSTIIDIGCAEGYYAVGLALRCPEAAIFAFDSDPAARTTCRETARHNLLDGRVTVLGACTPDELNRMPLSGSFLICDCEGYENQLLTPHDVPGLLHCDMLVELHDHMNPEITPELIRRFALTHDIRLIPSVKRSPDQYPALWYLRNRRDRELAVDEQRVPMNWAYLMTRSSRV